MRVISIIASKGGTGKTTLAAHLAVEAGDVAVIDTDPQGSPSVPGIVTETPCGRA